jgi:histidinol phosphatase-like PHP family hydrolase
MDKEGTKSTIIQESGEKTLKSVLERLAAKNLELYYFVEHAQSDKVEIEDIDNAINIETQLKFLNSNEYELDVIIF